MGFACFLFACVGLSTAVPSTIFGTRSGSGSQNMVVQYDCGVLYPAATTYAQLQFRNRNGTNARILVPSLTTGSPEAIAIDSVNRYLYVGQTSSSGAIERYNLDGTNKLVISTATLAAGSTWKARVIRLTTTHLYFAAEAPSGGAPTINRLLLSDLTTNQQLWIGAQGQTTVMMDLDRTNSRIYFLTTTQLWRMDYDGANQVFLANVTTGFTFGAAMLVLPARNKVYYAGGSFGYMNRINMDGTGQESLSANVGPWYTAGGGAFDPWYPESIMAIRYDSTEDLIYFLSGEFLIAAPGNAANSDAFKSGLVVKLDLQYTDTTDFELGWVVSSQETACRVPCDLPGNKRNQPFGMCAHNAINVSRTECRCQENPPVSTPKKYWGSGCTMITNPCQSTAMTWDSKPLCGNPRWKMKCTTDSSQSVSFQCNCPVSGEEYVYQNLANVAICTCPINNPKYLSLLGTPACGACSGVACLCSDVSPATVIDPILTACSCANATDCKASLCASDSNPSQTCRSVLQKVKYCLPNIANPSTSQLTLAYSVLSCDRNWYSLGSTNVAASSGLSGIVILAAVLAW